MTHLSKSIYCFGFYLYFTYVDENDKSNFIIAEKIEFSQEVKGIIGREVKFCHPPKVFTWYWELWTNLEQEQRCGGVLDKF